MKDFIFNIPTKIIFRKGIVNYIADEIPAAYHRILLVTDKTVQEKTDIISKIEKALKHRKLFVFSEVEENPHILTVEKGGEFARELKADLVVGIGGGSSMDAAKGIALLSTNSNLLHHYLSGNQPENKPLPIICIPTTSGTGSEVTPYAVFSDPEEQSKRAIAHDALSPVISFLDPELTYSMPEPVIISTGLDVLTHAVEAYLSDLSFDLNDAIAIKATKLVIGNLQKASKKNHEAMDVMAYASMMAGISITHASTILPHIMGYPLTVFHGVPHGLANAVLLPAFIDFLKENSLIPKKTLVLQNLFTEKGGMKNFIHELKVSTRLSDYGVQKGELPGYVKKVISKSDVEITPGNITEELIYKLYLNAFE